MKYSTLSYTTKATKFNCVLTIWDKAFSTAFDDDILFLWHYFNQKEI